MKISVVSAILSGAQLRRFTLVLAHAQSSDGELRRVKEENERLKNQNESLVKKTRLLEESIKDISESHKTLENEVDDLEQFSWKVCIEFAGIPKRKTKTLML